MSERYKPIKRSELENPSEVFTSIASLRGEAQTTRTTYLETIGKMDELCKQLRGVEILITGRLYRRGAFIVYPDDPKSHVDRLHVRIADARVETYEGQMSYKRHLPYIQFNAYSVENAESVSAYLGVGEFGVSAEIVESSPAQS